MARQHRNEIAATTPQPLGLILGLPGPMHQAAYVAAANAFPRWKFFSSRFPDAQKRIYHYEHPMLEALRNACTFVSSQPTLPVPRPSRFVVFYVGFGDTQLILSAFGSAAFLVALDVPDWHWPRGRHWRSNPDIVLPLLLERIKDTERGDAAMMQLRLEKAAKDEPLLLPPRNYFMPDDGDLTSWFDELIQNGMRESPELSLLPSKRFTHESLGKYFRRVGGKEAIFRLDKRGLIFATGPHGQHGAVRQHDLADIDGLQGYRYILEGLFRFGTPLRSGFQHDVQWQDRDLKEEFFWCEAVKKSVPITATHANIFANDSVR